MYVTLYIQYSSNDHTHTHTHPHTFTPSQRCGVNGLCLCNKRPPNLALRPLAEAAFREHYYRREHWNYFTEEADIGPVMLSLKAEEEGESYR